MRFRPSALEEFIATLPDDLQVMALNAVKEEHDRWERKDFTDEEKKWFKIAREFGACSAKTIDKIIIEALKEAQWNM